MNQAAASKVQLVGGADFAWNDAAYDPARAHRAAASFLASGDPATVEALLTFFDLENLAPTSASSGVVSQPQSPALAASLDAFRAAWSAGDRTGALAALRPVAERIAGAPDLIRAHVADEAFVADCAPWLDATVLWGRAFVRTLDGLAARETGDEATASAAFAESDALVDPGGGDPDDPRRDPARGSGAGRRRGPRRIPGRGRRPALIPRARGRRRGHRRRAGALVTVGSCPPSPSPG